MSRSLWLENSDLLLLEMIKYLSIFKPFSNLSKLYFPISLFPTGGQVWTAWDDWGPARWSVGPSWSLWGWWESWSAASSSAGPLTTSCLSGGGLTRQRYSQARLSLHWSSSYSWQSNMTIQQTNRSKAWIYLWPGVCREARLQNAETALGLRLCQQLRQPSAL